MKFFEYMSANDALSVLCVGFAVVFIALIAMVLFFSLLGMVMQAIEKASRKNATAKSKKSEESAKAKSAAVVEQTKPEIVVEDGVSDEVIAVISAAVAAMSDGDKRYALRSVKKSRQGGRPIWAMAGIRENTSSF